MNKLASYDYDILDHVLSGDLEKIAEVIKPLSKEAQSATIPDFDEQQERDNKDFALVTYHPVQGEIKKYAKYSKELTELNIAFLNEKIDDLPDEIIKVACQNLKQAAKDWGLEVPVKIAEVETEDGYTDPTVDLTEIDNYGYAVKLSEAQTQTYALPDKLKYPITGPSEIKKAQEYFEKYAHQFSPSEAIQYSRNVQTAAKRFDISTKGTAIDKFAELDVNGYNPNFEFYVKGRDRYLVNQEDKDLYTDITKIASEHPPTKIAKALEKADCKLGLDQHWGKGIENPALSVFKYAHEKVAEVTLQDLRNLDRRDLTAIVGNDAVSDLIGPEGVDVFNTLPRPLKREIENLIYD